MDESSWEAVRRKNRKFIFSLIFMLVPIFFLVGILIVNNRDLIIKPGRSSPNEKLVSGPIPDMHDSTKEQTSDSIAKTAVQPKETTVVINIPQQIDLSEKKNMPEKKAPGRPSKQQLPHVTLNELPSQPQIAESIVRDRSDKVFSDLLPPITCYLNSRKDIVIRLSLELFFKDEDMRATIQTHHEDIKVMVMKRVLNNDVADMKINLLEKQLHDGFMNLFKNSDLIALKIQDIKLEKARRR